MAYDADKQHFVHQKHASVAGPGLSKASSLRIFEAIFVPGHGNTPLFAAPSVEPLSSFPLRSGSRRVSRLMALSGVGVSSTTTWCSTLATNPVDSPSFLFSTACVTMSCSPASSLLGWTLLLSFSLLSVGGVPSAAGGVELCVYYLR